MKSDLEISVWESGPKFVPATGVSVVGGCVLVYARAHKQTTWVIDVSPGVGRTPGKPEESRLTKAQYTCGPYM